MATRHNSFGGVASGTNLSIANSGGSSGTAFDDVVPDNTSAMVVNTSADLTASGDRGLVVSNSSLANAYARWNVTAAVVGWWRTYLRLSSLTPPATLRVVRGCLGTTLLWDVRLTSSQLVLTKDGGAFRDQSGTLSTSTIYRVEGKIASDSTFEMRLYLGDSTTPESVTNYSANLYTGGNWDNIRFGQMFSAAQTFSGVQLAAVAWSDEGWIGPAVSDVDVAAVAALASATAVAPTLSSGVDLVAPAGAATGAAVAPAVSSAVTLVSPTATASGLMLPPSVNIPSTIVVPPIISAATPIPPTVQIRTDLTGPLGMEATATALDPVVSAGVSLLLPPGTTAAAEMLAPTVTVSAESATPAMTASAEMLAPSLVLGGWAVQVPPEAAASAEMLAPTVELTNIGINVDATVATASTYMSAPVVEVIIPPAPTFLLRTPVRRERQPGALPVHLNKGITLVVTGGIVEEVESVPMSRFDDADQVYLGGHEYLLSEAEAAVLTTAGYASCLSPTL